MRGLTLALAGLVFAAGCRAETPVQARTTSVRMAASRLAESLAREYSRTLPGLRVEIVQAGTTPVSVVDAIERGEADLGIAFADSVYSAYRSNSDTAPHTGAPRKAMRAISALHVAPLIFLARVDSGIHSITDLPGHPVRVSGTAPGDVRFRSGWKVPLGLGERRGELIDVTGLSQLVLLAFGVDPEAIHSRPLLQGDAVRELAAGTLDALFTTVYDSGDFVSLTMKSGARLIPLEGPAIERLRREYAFIRPVRIAPDTYAGQHEVLHTVGVDLVLICRSDLDEQLVYELTKAHLTALPRVWTALSMLPRLDLEKAPATPIPLHEGAARYYREWELFR